MIILFGKPGAGKGTQAELLVREEGFILVGAGELLRQAARHDQELASMINAGDLVGDDILLPLISERLRRYSHQRIILDGFPRNQLQADWLKQQLEKNPPERVDLIILEISDSEVYKRLARRGRTDDTISVIEARLKIYREDVLEAINLLGGAAQVHYIDGIGMVDDVHKRVIAVINDGKKYEDTN